MLLDLGRNNTGVTDTEVHFQDRMVTGSIASGKFCNKRNEYRLYFAMEFDATPVKMETLDKGAYISFAETVTTLHMRVGLCVSCRGQCRANLKPEIPHWSLEKDARGRPCGFGMKFWA